MFFLGNPVKNKCALLWIQKRIWTIQIDSQMASGKSRDYMYEI